MTLSIAANARLPKLRIFEHSRRSTEKSRRNGAKRGAPRYMPPKRDASMPSR
jgi:hypothetical protein